LDKKEHSTNPESLELLKNLKYLEEQALHESSGKKANNSILRMNLI